MIGYRVGRQGLSAAARARAGGGGTSSWRRCTRRRPRRARRRSWRSTTTGACSRSAPARARFRQAALSAGARVPALLHAASRVGTRAACHGWLIHGMPRCYAFRRRRPPAAMNVPAPPSRADVPALRDLHAAAGGRRGDVPVHLRQRARVHPARRGPRQGLQGSLPAPAR